MENQNLLYRRRRELEDNDIKLVKAQLFEERQREVKRELARMRREKELK